MIKYILSFILLFSTHTSFAIQCKIIFNNANTQIEFFSPKKKPHFVTKLSNDKLIVNFLKPTQLSCSKNIVINKVNSREYIFLLPKAYSKLSLSENKNSRFIKLFKPKDIKTTKAETKKQDIKKLEVVKEVKKEDTAKAVPALLNKPKTGEIVNQKIIEQQVAAGPKILIKKNIKYSPYVKYGFEGFAIIFPKLGAAASAISCLDDNLLILIEGEINYQGDITKSFRDRDLFRTTFLNNTKDFLALEIELSKKKNVISFRSGEDLIVFCSEKNIKQNFLKYSIDTNIKIDSKSFTSYRYRDQYGRDLIIYPSISGIDKKLSFPNLIIHKSASGVVLESLSDDLKIKSDNGLIFVGNIAVDSEYPADDEKYDEIDLRTTIFPFLKNDSNFVETFEDANYQYGKSEDPYDLLEIIKVLFKYSQYKEIIAIADELLNIKPEIFEQNIDAIMLVSAACIMESENSTASKVLREIKDINLPDFEFWANLANKKVELKNLLEVKDLYPYEILDFAIKIDPSDEKVKILHKEDFDVLFLKGKFLYDQGKFEAAYKIWDQIPKNDYKNTAKTIYFKSLQTKSLDDIPSLLDGSRLWRGTETEYLILVTIAEIYRDNGKLVEAMRGYRKILEISNLPSNSIFISSEMSKIFHQIFGKGNVGESIPDFDLISLFYEFRDFMPLGKEGDDITFNIAQRLLELDLYDQASQILRYQIIYKMRGEERVVAANSLSQIYLDNDQFKEAISILEDTDRYNFDYNLHIRRLEMRAEALLKTGKIDEAYDMISDNQSAAAKSIKGKIYIQKDLWDILPSVISGIDKVSILKLASAYAITNNFIALEKIKSETNDESIKDIIDFFLIHKKRINFFDIKNSLNLDILKNYKELYSRSLDIKL